MRKKSAFIGFALILCVLSGTLDLKAESLSGETEKNYSRIVFSAEYSPYYFEWKESADVKEEGWLHAFKVSARIVPVKCFFLPAIEPSFKIYGGDVRYKGETRSGEKIRSRTNYNGWEGELRFSYSFVYGKTGLKPYFGVGKEYWKRSVDSEFTSSGILATGYTEKWTQKYLKVGIKPEYRFGKYYIYGDLYAEYPWKIENEVSLFDVTVEPEEVLNYGFEAGVVLEDFMKKNLSFHAGLFYERERFKESDPEYSSVAGNYVFQPESERETYGLRIGIKF